MMDTSTLLTGSWPIRTHANRFYGTVKADGQHPRVAGLVCDDGDVVAISLVGYETSTSAVLSSLWLREAIPFLVAEGVEWKGPRNLLGNWDEEAPHLGSFLGHLYGMRVLFLHKD